MNAMTVSDFKKHYDPMRPKYIRLNGKMYCYNYNKLTFEQVMLAEELANLKRQRIEAFNENTHIPNAHLDLNYIAELVGILFVEAPNKKPKVWSEAMRAETEKNFKATTGPDNYEEIERCLRDFFIRRKKRMLASMTLMRNGSIDKIFPKMMEIASKIYSTQPSGKNDSTTHENSTGESKNASETQQSNYSQEMTQQNTKL